MGRGGVAAKKGERRKKREKKAPGRKRSVKKSLSQKEPFVTVTKHGGNPIISPDPSVAWRAWQAFNPAALYLDQKVHLLYRAIGNDGVSRFGYANSSDGFHVDMHASSPAYRESVETATTIPHTLRSGGSFAGCEDPRMVYIEEDATIYITYTSCVNGLRVALSSIRKDDFLAHRWHWRQPQHISAPHEVHKNWVLFPEKFHGKYAILHALNPISIAYVDTLIFNGTYIQSHYHPGTPTDDRWDSYIRGAGPPPIKTAHGWLLFYHAMHHSDMSEYRVGAMLLDLDDPTTVLHRAHAPVLTPEEEYETHGYKGGVVYLLGAVVKDGTLLLYYGGADSYVCVAHADLAAFLSELRTGATPLLQRKRLKRAVKK